VPIRREQRITRPMLRAEANTLWVFGDTLVQLGLGGQAREMRGEPNAVGIPTKRLPSRSFEAYLTDDDIHVFREAIKQPVRRLANHLQAGGMVVWPAAGISPVRADLQNRAPQIWEILERAQKKLEAL
jgi:hypothetical protein